MTQQVEAVFEEGVLRPLEPISLSEHQVVLLTISDVPQPAAINHRHAEQQWLKDHSNEYRGPWVALNGDSLISHGDSARFVREQARKKGVGQPLLVHIAEEPEQPSAGWL